MSAELLQRDIDPESRVGVPVSLPGSILSISAGKTVTLPLSIKSVASVSSVTTTPTASTTVPSSPSTTASSTAGTTNSVTPTSSAPITSPSSSGSSGTPVSTAVYSSDTSPSPSTATMFPTSAASSTGVAPSAVAALSSSHKNVGAIAGGVVGGVAALLLAIVGVFLYLRISRKMPTRSRRRSVVGGGDVRGPLGKWNGLSSRDSAVENGGRATRMKQVPCDDGSSAGATPMVSPRQSSIGHSKDPMLTQTSTEEDADSLGEEVKASPVQRAEYIDAVPPLPYAMPTPPPAAAGEYRRGRPLSGADHHALALARLNLAMAQPGARTSDSPYSASPSSAASGSPHTPAANLNRISSAGGVRRNPTRKPVPAYNAATLAAASTTSTNEASTTAAGTAEGASGASTPTRSVTPSRSREELVDKRLNIPVLNHKSSWGDARPMHYLVPDLPPAQRD
ncbi:hypothetical protein WOLCODRAFT_165398 [Wolfiporia cocos MD-104 SS10]|uniref:Uncharacterized protein n=1 Tax=Wolfiporia cocos (strain MD-104) TaxID=742152 RepID=A0A2H3JRK2_WOLCO|nr:hypothetical protein WOLCODRAFT_165398 [Wolfiporia cocos MD-104 SS10]